MTVDGRSLLLASGLLLVLWRYALRNRLVRPDAANAEVQFLTRRLTPGLAAYPVCIMAGLLVPVVVVVGYLRIALYDIIPLPGRGSSPFRRHVGVGRSHDQGWPAAPHRAAAAGHSPGVSW